MNIEKEREAFEKWVSGSGLNTTIENGLYRSHVVEWMWHAWQAALQSSEIQALRKDAERYRWLRDGNGYYPEENYLRGGVELDDGVDLSMEKQK